MSKDSYAKGAERATRRRRSLTGPMLRGTPTSNKPQKETS
jgi:hypothetical protein